MHARRWPRCLAQDPTTGAWCTNRPSDGVFCPVHASEFRFDQAARAATRLARARLTINDRSTTPLRRWWATHEARRQLVLRRHLVDAMPGSTAASCGTENLVRTADERYRG